MLNTLLTLCLLGTPADVAQIVAQDITEPDFQKYIWIPNASEDYAAEVNFTFNEIVSRTDLLVRPVVLADGQLLRYDLRQLATNANDLLDLQFLFLDIAFDDPYFYLRTPDHTLIDVAPYTLNGKQYTQKHLRVSVPQYQVPLGSVFRFDKFIEITNRTVSPGRYYDFVDIDDLNLKEFLARLDIRIEELDNFTKDERAALFESKPTHKQRLIKILTSNVVRPSKSRGIVAVTYDITDEQQEAINDPLENLLNFDFAAYEIIVDRPNGTHLYALYDKAGKLLKEGDPKIAADHKEAEKLGTKVLQAGLSCRRCHAYGHGWQDFRNDVLTMLDDGFSVVDDLQSPFTQDETLSILARLYNSEPSKGPFSVLEIGRQMYRSTVSKITVGRTLPMMGDILDEIHTNYNLRVTPDQACIELGIKTEDSLKTLREIFPNIPGKPELQPVGSLKRGIPLQRTQFERVYPYLMTGVLNANITNN